MQSATKPRPSGSERRSDLDVMGVLVVLGLVFFHSALILADNDGLIRYEPPSTVALVVVSFASLWGMPLMYLIAGMAIRYSLRVRTVGQFLRERVTRLLVPFVTGMLLVLPPQVYYGQRQDPAYAESYLRFYPRFFRVRSAWSFPLFVRGAPPDELFTISYLYFLVYLFAYTVLLLPLWLYLLKPAGQRLVERLAAFFARPWAIFILALPIVILEAALGTEPHGNWNRFSWAPFIVYGFLFACDGRFEKALQRQWVRALLLGIPGFGLYFGGLGVSFLVLDLDPWTDYGPVGILVRIVKGLGSWLWVVAILGYAGRASRKRAATQTSPEVRSRPRRSALVKRAVRYLQGAQLPFYILHYLPIRLVGFHVVRWEVNALVKYVVIVLSSLVVTLLLYEIGVRRTRPTRFLFGVKPRR